MKIPRKSQRRSESIIAVLAGALRPFSSLQWIKVFAALRTVHSDRPTERSTSRDPRIHSLLTRLRSHPATLSQSVSGYRWLPAHADRDSGSLPFDLACSGALPTGADVSRNHFLWPICLSHVLALVLLAGDWASQCTNAAGWTCADADLGDGFPLLFPVGEAYSALQGTF
jgi:hypothetical protein